MPKNTPATARLLLTGIGGLLTEMLSAEPEDGVEAVFAVGALHCAARLSAPAEGEQ